MEKQSSQIQKEIPECILCYEQERIIGISKCNHKPFCYKCIYKLRELNDSQVCPLCSAQTPEVIITTDHEKEFQQYDLKKLILLDEHKRVYATDEETENAIMGLNTFKCFIPNCKEQVEFQAANFLKKHLKEKHQRYLCDTCLEYKLCVLTEQKIYTYKDLEKHLKYGDHDEDGNIYFLHPYCEFCKRHFYDEEQIANHLRDHLTCPICGPEQKFRYYNQYENLEKHFSISHYLCDDPLCRKTGLAAFKTQVELEQHKQKEHTNQNYTKAQKKIIEQMTVQSITGFTYEEDKYKKYKNMSSDIKDEEGKDFSHQFLSLRKTKMKVSNVEEHKDVEIDIRDVYNHHFDKAAFEEEKQLLEAIFYSQQNKNKKNKKQQGGGKQRVNNADPFAQIKLEDLKLIKPQQYYHNDEKRKDKITEKLSMIFDDDNEWEELMEKKSLYHKKKITAEEFLDYFLEKAGLNLGMRIFPQLASLENEHHCRVLDQAYYKKLISLPKKVNNLVNASQKYSEFFKKLQKELEINILKRIDEGKIDLKKRIKMERERKFQLIEILRRIKVQEMIKLKFITNFGLSVENIDFVLNKIFMDQIEKIQDNLNVLPSLDVLYLNVYVSYCLDLLMGKEITRDKREIDTNILKDVLEKNPKYLEKYINLHKKSKDGDSDEDESDEEEQKIQNPLHKLRDAVPLKVTKPSNQVKDQDPMNQKAMPKFKIETKIDTDDKYEFPSMSGENESNKKKTQQPAQEQALKKQVVNDWEKKNPPLIYETSIQNQLKKNNNLLKKEFPSLMDMNDNSSQLKMNIVEAQIYKENEQRKAKREEKKQHVQEDDQDQQKHSQQQKPVKHIDEDELEEQQLKGRRKKNQKKKETSSEESEEDIDTKELRNLKVIGQKQKGRGKKVLMIAGGFQ